MKKKIIITALLAIIAVVVIKKGVSFVCDKIEVMNAPTMQEIAEANPWTVPADWFKTDTITIKGRIEDYDAEQFGFSSMACYYEDVFEKGTTVLVLDIADDGTFCKKFQASFQPSARSLPVQWHLPLRDYHARLPPSPRRPSHQRLRNLRGRVESAKREEKIKQNEYKQRRKGFESGLPRCIPCIFMPEISGKSYPRG